MTPQRDEQNRRSTDAARLTFPLQLVIIIVGGFLASAGAFWLSTGALRSDVRDILTRMESQVRIDAEKAEAQKLRDATIRDQLAASERRQELLRLEFEKLREEVLFKGKR